MHKKKICHITTAHLRNDIRIFLKECCSLAAQGYETHLIVADNQDNATINGVYIHPIGKDGGKFDRVFRRSKLALKLARELKADIYHIHDPEIFWLTPLLKRRGRVVVLDLHEDFPAQIKSKKFIPKFLRPLVSWLAGLYERICFSFASGLVTATPHIKKVNYSKNENIVIVNNYPRADEFGKSVSWTNKERAICYIGGLTEIRGINYFIEAAKNQDFILYIAGPAQDGFSKEVIASVEGVSNIRYLGPIDRAQVNDVLAKSVAGLVTYLPEPNHLYAMPNKLFEYMSAGLPVIASHFESWDEIVTKNQCGITVDPADVQEIRSAMVTMVANIDRAKRMGDNGKRIINEHLNWDKEQHQLIKFYQDLLATY